jgi:ADP-heptose:LPS heptosyltransferase
MVEISDIKFDCRHFRGHIPCKPNKLYGAVCSDDCQYYDKTDTRILIIKLGAAGDVIRTTPLLYPLKEQYPNSKIYWLTYSPDLVPLNKETTNPVDEVMMYNLQNVSYLLATHFDVTINLDKDNEAISLMKNLSSGIKLGFTERDGYCYPANKDAEHKFITGLFDQISEANTKSYLEEMFEICGYKFNGEEYILYADPGFDMDWDIDINKKAVGLNTGCGSRWVSRQWADERWLDLINLLTGNGFEVVLLGGPEEDAKNKMLSSKSTAKYFGTYPLKTFINLVNKCDIVITQVTMAMHIALGLKKNLLLINNIFNPNEFELYGRGEIISPSKECKCYFAPKCTNDEYRCMEYLFPKDIAKIVSKRASFM